MRAHGDTSVWRTHSGVSRARDAKSWYQHLRDWWAEHQAARREATLVSLRTCWNGRREGVTPFHADVAPDMGAAQHTLSVAFMLSGLSS
jgi:hypothetical protein